MKPKPRKSKDKIKPNSPLKKPRSTQLYPKPAKKSKKQSKAGRIYSQIFLDRIATKIQRVWRGYITRKKFKKELAELTGRIGKIKEKAVLKASDFWEAESSHSIIQL